MSKGDWLLLTPAPRVGLVSCYLRAISVTCTEIAGAGVEELGQVHEPPSNLGKTDFLPIPRNWKRSNPTYLPSSFSEKFSGCPQKNLHGRKRGWVWLKELSINAEVRNHEERAPLPGHLKEEM